MGRVTGEKPNTESNTSLVAKLKPVQTQLSEFKASFENFKRDSNNVQAKEKSTVRPPQACELCVAASKRVNCHHCLFAEN